MKLGITGATGQLGRLVVEKLKQRVNAGNLVALVRSPEKAADLGIEARNFDYTKPETLTEGLKGIDHLLLISASEVGQRITQHQNIIRAAETAGVKWIVYTSLLHADTSTLSLAEEHIETEKLLKESGIPYTILRNGWYTENYTGSVHGALSTGAFVGSAGEGKISSATREDFAEAAAIVFSGEGHVGKVYELAGDEAYTLKDLAAEISKQTGKTIPYNNLSEAEYAQVLSSVGLPEGLAQAYAGFDTGAAKGDLFDDSKALSKLLGRPTTSLSDAVKKALA
ncbi:Male sterility domain protein [Pseudopedobacter saltans DSM 12145]|uniref:Male sterility domain protein n=1 Tax=Pseudopedobacter saltans (strain ATCC 51119 / DSM 12145 / JCM 21818 / CCUG 39354 / LMG 10337 / NBRC 100064 / NCIMB 13643) TaxID=762903 RepID=F0S7X4_PSESL|nr:SDR family oxidoreductase [Pseudopedobacter saltans]ADY51195.1 Male sterility domain protein [Pseudopedobacter saltans DSM 12145]